MKLSVSNGKIVAKAKQDLQQYEEKQHLVQMFHKDLLRREKDISSKLHIFRKAVDISQDIAHKARSRSYKSKPYICI